MFTIRGVVAADLPAVVGVARHLNSVNLPADATQLSGIIDRSERSFAGTIEAARREFMFALCRHDPTGDEHVVGVSMLFAQHGTRQAPHSYFDVLDEERYSEMLDRHFRHTLLRIGYNYRGVTEIGGLVLVPELRGHPEHLGMSLSYVRFLYLARHRALFRDDVISELMPPLEADGTSLLWEALGRHFTGLSYQEADRLSRQSKEFIRSLFPQDPIYASLLPERAQALIGQVGPTTKPVERMLRRVGFKYAHRIDPFDGGPHFHAHTDEILPVAQTRAAVVNETPEGEPDGRTALVAADRDAPPFFKAVRARVRLQGEAVDLPARAARELAVGRGDAVAVLPLDLP